MCFESTRFYFSLASTLMPGKQERHPASNNFAAAISVEEISEKVCSLNKIEIVVVSVIVVVVVSVIVIVVVEQQW